MLKDLARELTPPFLWRLASRLKSSSHAQPSASDIQGRLHRLHIERNQTCAPNEIRLRDGLSLRIHPDSREPFEYFCFRDPDMVAELDLFLENSKECKSLLDIGALHGIFALAFAATDPSHHAVAVDASPIAFARLLYNTKKNVLEDRVLPVECALSDSEGWLAMKYEFEHAVVGEVLGANGPALLAEKTTGDLLCSRLGFRPDVIKIDVEGHEVKVLHGLTDVVKGCRPLVFLEVHPSAINFEGEHVEEIIEFFESLEYEAFHPSWGKVEQDRTVKIRSIHRLLYRPKPIAG
jgi:FkbM family methyltransferase